MNRVLMLAVGLVAWLYGGGRPELRRDQRGLSQSTENAILLAGAVTVATAVIIAITAYVKSKMPK